MRRIVQPVAVTLLFVLPLTLDARSAFAVVVAATLGNTSRPADDPGWDNIGILKNSTAIYLGEGWVLTAAHVGSGSVTFPGLGSYAAEAGSSLQLTNPAGSGLTKPADLVLFRLVDPPELAPIPIGPTPKAGDEVLVVGNGLERSPDLVYWDVTQRGTSWTWKETSPPGDYSGYQTTGPQILRWGTNLVEDDETFGNDLDSDILLKLRQTNSDTLTIVTEFDRDGSQSDDDVRGPDGSSATADESQGVLSDSGGSMFIKRDNQWQLVGTILAVDGERDQPDVTRNPLFGNITYYADLATYLDQIESRVVYGDFDGDLQLTAADIDALSSALATDSDSARFDLNRDGVLSAQDHQIWVEDVKATYLGDANLDGQFDTEDLIQVLQRGQYEDRVARNSTWESGDWNADLEFDSSDFVAASQSGGFELGPRYEASVVVRSRAVPEPGSLAGPLATLVLIAGWPRHLRIRRRSARAVRLR